MTIKQDQERIADFPPVMDQSGNPLDTCLLGLISATGRFQNLRVALEQAQRQLAHWLRERLWLLTAACNELGVDLENAAESHLRLIAEMAKNRPPESQEARLINHWYFSTRASRA